MRENPFAKLRVGIIGNCQGMGLRSATKFFLPGADVQYWRLGVTAPTNPQELLALMSACDVIISQVADIHRTEMLRISSLRQAGLPVVFLPSIAFRGFHPDVIYLRNPGTGGLINGVGTQYHSAIVAAAFSLGLPEDRIEDLFNTYVFAELGYFDAFAAEKAAFLAGMKAEGYDLEPVFDGLVAKLGSFMYSINHPHIRLLAIMCRIALAKRELIDAETPLPVRIADQLSNYFVCPVYPQIAKRVGVSGSAVFLRANRELETGQTRELPLADYIASSMRQYAGLPPTTFRDPFVAKTREQLKAIVD